MHADDIWMLENKRAARAFPLRFDTTNTPANDAGPLIIVVCESLPTSGVRVKLVASRLARSKPAGTPVPPFQNTLARYSRLT